MIIDYAEPLIFLRSASVEYENAMQDGRYNAAVLAANSILISSSQLIAAVIARQITGEADPLTRKQCLEKISNLEISYVKWPIPE